MKKAMTLLMVLVLMFTLTACSDGNDMQNEGRPSSEPQNSQSISNLSPKPSDTPADDSATSAETGGSAAKALVVYFSWSGNTESVANEIAAQTGADIFRIISADEYTDDYDTLLSVAQEEQKNDARPAISGSIENLDQYDVVYVGFPNWWGDMPMILYTFFDEYDLSGKIIAPFVTSGGSGFSDSISTMKSLEPDATIVDGLSLGSSQAANPADLVTDWLNDLSSSEVGEGIGTPAFSTLSAKDSLEEDKIEVPENFVLIEGGSFQMGSPKDEAWRSADEVQHTVTVSDFYISRHELMQSEYQAVMGENPSHFSGEALPVENVSWLDAIAYCNACSSQEGLTPVYTIDGQNVSWDRSADGYRLPTEAEWEYACRAGTTTPFYIEDSPSAENTNFYGHYPYMIEDNYFSQGNLEVKPGEYRQTTVAVGSFDPSPNGLYDMYGNVSEWVWDYYGAYLTEEQTNPTGPESGALRVYRGGGWNDFAKNMRSAYRATMEQDKSSFNLGIRLVRNAVAGIGSVTGSGTQQEGGSDGDILIAYFSWGGNTQGIAEEIASQTGADQFEITLVTPYSSDYNTVLEEAQRDQNEQARPELASHVENMEQYDTILLGYPNWWASIPMPIASFLEEYDFSDKTVIPFCSHGGGEFGQSLTAIAKLIPDASIGEALSIHYSGGSSMPDDVSSWLSANKILDD